MKENLGEAHKLNEEALRQQQLIVEYNSLKKYCPSGIYVLPQVNNINIWQGVIFIRQGYFKDGIFRFKIEIPENYPNSSPHMFFHNYIFHPLIDFETLELSIGAQFPEWQPGKHFIFSLLGYLKKVFYSTEQWTLIKHVLNPQALNTFTEDEILFIQEARRCVIDSQNFENRVEKDSEIHFKKFNSFHSIILKNIRGSIERPSEFMKYFRDNFI
jgi:ubiquitin-protein ligase